MKMLGRFTHGHCTEFGCCEPHKTVRESKRRRKWHRKVHRSEVRRYKRKEKDRWKQLAESNQL
ncbi:hypothetical protein SEA_NICEHOUSE_115 [Rhodococcus phage NiceHouse]|nr:hypothetical protein SEA_NICEHOUSE_115 [Rhodococcus phage NiceHouse]